MPEWLQIALFLLVSGGASMLGMWVLDRPRRFERDYWVAAMQDKLYHDAHPDCSYDEAHQHRRAVRRRYHRW